MKQIKFLFVLLSGILLFSNCKKKSQDQFESSATISGFDPTLCSCCGGWKINIIGEQTDLRFSELPENSSIDLANETFPLSVNLNWSESDEYCGNGITIESIEIIE